MFSIPNCTLGCALSIETKYSVKNYGQGLSSRGVKKMLWKFRRKMAKNVLKFQTFKSHSSLIFHKNQNSEYAEVIFLLLKTQYQKEN